MNRHLQAGWRTARIGLAFGLFIIFSEPFGVAFGDTPEWGMTLFAASLMPLLLGIGGVLYGIILPRLARERTPASAGASILAGTAAGVATMSLFAGPLLVIEPATAGVVAFMLGFGAWVGTIGGIYVTKTRRMESAAARSGEA